MKKPIAMLMNVHVELVKHTNHCREGLGDHLSLAWPGTQKASNLSEIIARCLVGMPLSL